MFEIILFGIVAFMYYQAVKKNQSKHFSSWDEALELNTHDYRSLLFQDADFYTVRDIVDAEFSFNREWDEQTKMKFIWRTISIRRCKRFHEAEGMVLTMRHEVIISATMARLTMGLSKYYELPMFELIEVYPREFYSKLLNQHVKGLTIGNGRLFLSWAHFEAGHEDATDKVHVGLHEFAHAMMLQFEQFKFVPQWEDWTNTARPIMQSIRLSGNHFFRQYGATNIHEFWAVAVETFFEQPKEFNTKYPELFRHTCIMLNQWPLVVDEV